MAKFSKTEWDEVRKKFHQSIMADTSLVSLAQNLDINEWPLSGEEEKPSKYIDFNYDELLMLPEIMGKTERIDHLVSILKETLAFDDPFGDMVAQVEETSAKENPILKTLARLGISEEFPLLLCNFSEGTLMVCSSEGVKTIGGFANLGQQMSTRVVLGGDFRVALNALTHGDEEGISRFLPYRKGAPGLHLAEAVGLVAAGLPRADQLALGNHYGARLTAADLAAAKPLNKAQVEKMEASLQAKVVTALEWFKDDKTALLKQLADGTTYDRYFVVINDPAREAIASRLAAGILKVEPQKAVAPEPAKGKAGGFFARLFGKS